MEVDRRPFQSINIGMASVETARDRFTTDEIHRPLPHARWRCNLTALSQRYNLYFMASRDGIAVYEPDFPFQKLKRLPKLYIPPTLAKPGARGYLDSGYWEPGQHPHDINHLIVGDLGSEEILLVSTDSGNVTAYHTKAIYEAAQRDPYHFSPEGQSDFVGLRSFFSQWVRESAWGLAIHKAGRMIAVSANVTELVCDDDLSAKVTVFAFALSPRIDHAEDSDEDDHTDGEADHTEWHNWDPSSSNEPVPQRDRNYKTILAGVDGHSSNIPSISFVNTEEDPEGSWLLSCDIYGDTKCWQIWRGVCHGTWDFAEGFDALRRRRQRRTDGGWMVAALEPSSFRPAHTMEAFCGHNRVPQYHGHLGTGDSYDITNIVRLKTPGRSQRHPLHEEESEEDENEAPEPEEVAGAWSSDESEDQSDVRRPYLLADRGPRPARLVGGTMNLPEAPQRHENPDVLAGDVSPRPIEPVSDQTQQVAPDIGGTSDQTTVIGQEIVDVSRNFDRHLLINIDSDDEAEPESEGEVMDMQLLSGDDEDSASSSDSNMSTGSVSNQTQRTSVEVEIGPPLLTSSPEISSGDAARSLPKPATPTKRRRSHFPDPRPIRIPYIPTLHLSQSHLRLINLPRSRSPHLFCANILKQDLPEAFNHTHHYGLGRLNMLQQIPELGIVIIASQLGRAAVCSLTKYVPSGALGLRVDWILPTRRQEKAGARPTSHELLGIAVAPIQGREMPTPDPQEEREDEGWARDRSVDGVETTFDEKVVVLSPPRNQAMESNSEDDSPRQRAKRRPAKRKRRSFSSMKSSSSSSAASTEIRPWPAKPPKQAQDWEGVDGTRRYRLMMTYSDLTVLSYEIGRGLEREDVAVSVAGEDL